MPKRRVKQVSWEILSERMPLTPVMEGRARRVALKRTEQALAELAVAPTAEDAFYSLPRATSAAWQLGRFEEACRLAKRSIALAEQFSGNWNYANALHAGHTVLGLLALRGGNAQQAVVELHASGNVRGSPQLNSFGPSMQLAKALITVGEMDAVLAYFGQCRTFWSFGSLWLSIWEKKVKRGAMPNFSMNLYR